MELHSKMKIHKTTDTNVTLCGIATPGKVMAFDWKHVDCRRCLIIGQREFLDRYPIVEASSEQLELGLDTETQTTKGHTGNE